MFSLASSVCKSLQCLILTLTQGGKGGHLFRLICSVVLVRVGGARCTLQTNIAGVYEECLQCLGHTGFAPAHGVCVLPVYTAQAPGCSAGVLSKAGPMFRALTRSKLLRFRFSSAQQGHRLGGACVLCPSQVHAAQATRCLASTLSPGQGGGCHHLPHPSRSLSPCGSGGAVSGVPCVPSGELISVCDPPG